MLRVKGNLGEALAEHFLKKRGFRILGRNVKNHFGELDLIAQEKETVVFVEVKSLWGEKLLPEEAIGRRKMIHLKKAALLYLQEKGWLHQPVRFDVVAIHFLRLPGRSRIRHLRNVLL